MKKSLRISYSFSVPCRDHLSLRDPQTGWRSLLAHGLQDHSHGPSWGRNMGGQRCCTSQDRHPHGANCSTPCPEYWVLCTCLQNDTFQFRILASKQDTA